MIHYYITPAVDGEVVRAKARKEARETGQVVTVHGHAKGMSCYFACEAIYEAEACDTGHCAPEHVRSCRRCG